MWATSASSRPRSRSRSGPLLQSAVTARAFTISRKYSCVALHTSELSILAEALTRARIAATLALASARLRSQPEKWGASSRAGGAARTAIVKVAGMISPTNATDATTKRLSSELLRFCSRLDESATSALRQHFEQ